MIEELKKFIIRHWEKHTTDFPVAAHGGDFSHPCMDKSRITLKRNEHVQ